MVLPGWNVSEPIQLAIKLYDVVEALKDAPEGARAFVAKVNGFRRLLEELGQTLEFDSTTRSSKQELDHLGASLVECQDCVRRCQDFGDRFKSLTKDGGGSMTRVGQAARYLWQDKKVARLRAEIDSQINSIQLSLTIKTFTESRSRQNSAANSPIAFSSPQRTGTFSSLPPYSPPRLSWGPEQFDQRPRTPADILNLRTRQKEERSGGELESGKFKYLLESDTVEERTFESPKTSPNPLRGSNAPVEASGLDEDILTPLESRKGTENEVVAGFPDSLGIYASSSTSESCSSKTSGPSTDISSPISLLAVGTEESRKDLSLAWEPTTLEAAMDRLEGVKICFHKSKSRISYPVARIQSLRDNQTRRRYVVIKPPVSSNVEFFLFLPSERLIPHSEHPEAYGAAKEYRVKFVQPCLLSSQKLSAPRKGSNASTMALTPTTTASSAASLLSMSNFGSPVLAAMTDASFREESRRQEYIFEKEEDYRHFQELLMGQDVKLQLQVPIHLVTFKRYNEGKASKQSELQYLRLWQSGRHQYLMLFCNVASGQYREYKVENFRPIETKSKTVVRLDVHLAGMIRRDSKDKSPTMIAHHSTQGHPPEVGLTREIDVDDLRTLDSMTIEFSHAEGKSAFLREACFHGLRDGPSLWPVPFQRRSSTA